MASHQIKQWLFPITTIQPENCDKVINRSKKQKIKKHSIKRIKKHQNNKVQNSKKNKKLISNCNKASIDTNLQFQRKLSDCPKATQQCINEQCLKQKQTSTSRNSQDSNSKLFSQKISFEITDQISSSPKKQQILMDSNIERQMHLAKLLKKKVLCYKFQSIRPEYLDYVRQRGHLLRLSREGCQLVIYYMDEYYSKRQYLQQQAALIFTSFFIIASKVVEQCALPMNKLAADIQRPYQQLCEMEIKVMIVLNFKVAPTTYIPILNTLLMEISECPQVSINFFEQKQENYILVRRIYLACQIIYDQLDTIDISTIKIIVRKALETFLPDEQFQIISKYIIGQVFEEQSVQTLVAQVYQQTKDDEQKFKQDYKKRTLYRSYGIFVNTQR